MTKENMIPIVEKAASGDTSAFETLFRTYWNMAYFYCFKYLKNKSEAEEVAQDAFFILFRNIDKLKNPKLFVAYFSKILVNSCHNRSKSRRNKNDKITFPVDHFTETLPEERIDFLPEVAMNQQELKNEIINFINELPKKQREVMLLHFVNDLSQSEIAVALDVKPSVIGNRLFHAKAALKQKLDKQKKTAYISYVAPIALLPLITQFLREEMAQVATPDIQARVWDGLQAQISAYVPGQAPVNSYTSSLINVGTIATACTAVVCFAVLGINYYNSVRSNEQPASIPAVVAQVDTTDILEELRAVTTLDGFNNFVAYHTFGAVQAVTWNTELGETQYRLYQRTFYDMTIFTGVRSNSSGVLIVYEVAPPGASPPHDAAAWINERIYS